MKFSHQIQFNAVPDWAEYYLPYSNLKKLIYSIEKEHHQQNRPSLDIEDGGYNEQAALMGDESTENSNDRFTAALDKSLEKIVAFYTKKEEELYNDLNETIASYDSLNLSTHIADNENDSGEDSYLLEESEQPYSSFGKGDAAWPKEVIGDIVDIKKRLVDLFVLLSELKSFIALNLTAFAKILKKYDKITNSNLKRHYTTNTVSTAYPFQIATRSKLNECIQESERTYAVLATGNNSALAIDELKTHLREHIVWERNTIWRDLVGQERKVQNVGLSESKPTAIMTPFGTMRITRDQVMNYIVLAICIAVFIALLRAEIFDTIEQNRCLAILVFASMLWAGEVMPLFVTALLVPFLIITLRVMRSDDGKFTRLSAPDATKRVFAAMFSPVIMLLLGGFSIAGTLSKFGIAKSMATFVLSKAGTRPNRVLLVNMLVATLASMWISNVAAPVLCFSLIQPILRTLPTDSRFAPCLIMGIALASNLGGMASPISSPQNIIAIQNMSPPPSWGEWFILSIPLCLMGNFIIWLWLLWNYNPERQTPHIHPIRATKNPINGTQIYIIIVTIGTILLWCLAHTYESTFGDMGVIAILPLIAFFGTGLLTKDDFNNFLWNVIMLAMGGIALGKAVESSGLLKTIASQIETAVTGFSAFQVLFVFSCLVLVIATFISHTVAALIVLPIVAEVGSQLANPQPRMLVMGIAFVCSVAMGLPVSGFPNMNAISQENELGKPYLTTKDFLINGVPSSIFSMLCVTIVGYGLMVLIGF